MSQNKTKNTTIWERFQTEGLAEKDSRPEAVAQFVSIENANMLKGFIPNGTNEEAAEEATVFFVNFSAYHFKYFFSSMINLLIVKISGIVSSF